MTTNPTPAIDWERVKADRMRKAVLCKFETYTDIRNISLFAGYQDLVENAPGDYCWGYGQKGTGKNMLGKILMEVRGILRSA